MMDQPYLIIDSDYLCHRAQHVFGDMLDRGSTIGAVYGFLSDIVHLRERFSTERLIFCWDYGASLRKKINPNYKKGRTKKSRYKDRTPEEERAWRKALQIQMKKLREEYLPTIGYRNIFYQDGYEADDIIAMICQCMASWEQGIIISCDQDLWQCLRSNVSWYNPRKRELLTFRQFQRKFEIPPKDWAKVKAIAGCRSDNIPGIRQVGEVKALAYIRGSMPEQCGQYKKIQAAWKDTVLANRNLVKLPFRGTKPVTFQRDHVTQEGWNRVTKKLRMKSIRYRPIV